MKCKKELIFLSIMIFCMIPLRAYGLGLKGIIQGHVYYLNTPASNINVVLFGNGFAATTTTNAEGYYRFEVYLEPGYYTVRAVYNSDFRKSIVFSFIAGDYSFNLYIPDVYWYDVTYNGGIGPMEHGYSFAIIADPHIGEGEDDYGTEGYEDEPPVGDVGNPAKKLRCVVQWINANKDAYKIRFVAVLGDITDSGERSEFLKAKEILDALSIPWIPLLGNHDVLPYYIDGASIVREDHSDTLPHQWFYDPKYNDLIVEHPSWNWEREPVPERYYFQQIAFDYGYYHFVCCDFQTRSEPIPIFGGGAMPEADLYEPGGYTWFKSHLRTGTPRFIENIIILMHHNFCTCSMGTVCFSSGELNNIKNFFGNEGLKPLIHTQFGGHHHESVEVWDGSVGLNRVLTDACKSEAGCLRVVKMYQPTHLIVRYDTEEEGKVPIDFPYWLSYKASDSIVAAGDGTYFIIEGDGEDGPKVTMAAGNRVYLKDGFYAEEGCNFRASTDFWPDDFNPMLSKADQSEIATGDTTKVIATNETKEPIPTVFSCSQNSPNPFNINTTIRYGLPKSSKVSLCIYNLVGQKVQTLVDANESAGYKSVSWDGRTSSGTAVPQGIYFYAFKAGDFSKHYKMIVIK